MKDVLYYMKLNHDEMLNQTKFKNIISTHIFGSLLTNLIYLRESYEKLVLSDSITNYERLIYKGKLFGVQEIIIKSNLYEEYYDDICDYGKTIEKIFYLIKEFENRCRSSLRSNDRATGLYYLSASCEVNNIINLIDMDYLKRCRKEIIL